MPIHKGPQKTVFDSFYVRRLLTAMGIIGVTALIIYVLFYAFEVFLLVFAGILFAVFLTAVANWVTHHSRLSPQQAMIVVLLILFLGVIAFLKQAMPPIIDEMAQLRTSLPVSLKSASTYLMQFEWFQQISGIFQQAVWLPPKDIVVRTAPFASSMIGGLVGLFIIVITGIYFAFDYQNYINSFIQLFPKERRPRIREVVQNLGDKLSLWLLGKSLGMLFIGVLTIAGLKLLGINLAVILGVIAGVLTFIPNLGPILSAIPAVLIASVEGPQHALWVILLYVSIQIVETYFVTPFIERRTIQVLPAMTIFAQILFGVLMGFLGLLLATPLLIVMIVLVQEFYIKDVLNDGQSKPLE